jgi:hypothetical protein
LQAVVFSLLTAPRNLIRIHQIRTKIAISTSLEDIKEGVPIYLAGAVDYFKNNNFIGNLMVFLMYGAM